VTVFINGVKDVRQLFVLFLLFLLFLTNTLIYDTRKMIVPENNIFEHTMKVSFYI